MKNICSTTCILIIGFLLNVFPCLAQDLIPLKVLEKDYPSLMEKFGNEVKNQRANYLFAIDVSGTMKQYANIVIPAMSQFIESLEEGDNVNIIRFGTAAKVSLGGFSDISKETKMSLKQYIQKLYEKDLDLYAFTDLNCLLDQINKQLQIQKNDLTFIFVLTDFVNDPAPGKKNLTAIICKHYRESLEARGVDHTMYMYALQLPVKGDNQLDLFKTAIPESFRFETFSITSPQALKSWFDRKKAEILLDRFRAIINRKQTDLHVIAEPEITIDGKIIQHISWKPNELFTTLSLDSVQVDGVSDVWMLKRYSGLPFDSEDDYNEIFGGKVKHQSWGFHQFNGILKVKLSLPTSYDNELKKLEISKPEISINQPISKIIFTFCLPLWLTGMIILLLLLYSVAVVRAFFRNRSYKWKINGRIVVEHRAVQILEYPVNGETRVGVGCDGMPVAVSAYNCDWQLIIYQKTFCCLQCWKKPLYKVTLEKGSGFETANGNFMLHDITSIAKGDFISIDNFNIIWCD